jgi:serine/threonine protein kinase
VPIVRIPRVLSIIGRGAFGRVEKVRLSDGSQVARKVLDPIAEALADEDLSILRRRFIREVKVQRQLGAQFVMPILDAGLEDETPWFTMPLAERTLEDEIASESPDLASPNVWMDILGALEELHGELHGLIHIHRDLKPSNVLLYDRRWRLADYGLVKPLSGASARFTRTAVTGGSMMYCSPEQFHNFRDCEPSTDIYAFGCMLHDAFIRTRRFPYQQYTEESPIGWIIAKCTEVEPARRFKRVGLIRDALLKVLKEPSESVKPGQKDWAQALEQIDTWKAGEAQDFARHLHRLRGEEAREERNRDYAEITEEALTTLFALNVEAWRSIARDYCEWSGDGFFPFSYCDSLARRLELIADLGDVTLTATAAIAAARLGASHTRWFVMKVVVRVCGPEMDDRAAELTAIEIVAESLESEFMTCVTQIGRQKSAYHPRIAEVLTDPSEMDEE